MLPVEARLLFLQKFLSEGRRVASFAPSGRALARVACRGIDAARPQTIVELGAGTGAITEWALAHCHARSRLVAVEVDPDFVRVLRARCPRAVVVEGDAAQLPRHLEALGLARIDLLISGLGLPSLDAAVRGAVLEAYHRLATPGAWFSQLTVMPLVFWCFYRRLFREVRFDWALWNAPPAGVYHCRNLRPVVAHGGAAEARRFRKGERR